MYTGLGCRFLPLQDKVLAGNAFEFLGLDRAFFEKDSRVLPQQRPQNSDVSCEVDEDSSPPSAKQAKVTV